MSWLEPLLHWLAVHTGTVNEGGPYYGFWSGFGSDIGEVAILGGLASMYRKHNCHTDGCWRVGKHTVNGSPWCSRHHLGARAAVAVTLPDTTAEKLAKLSQDVSDLAEAVRASVLPPPAARNAQRRPSQPAGKGGM